MDLKLIPKVLQWQYSGVAIPFLLGTGIAVAMASPADYTLACCLVVASGLWGLGWWLTREPIRRRWRVLRRAYVRRDVRRIRAAGRSVALRAGGGTALWCLVILGCLWFVHYKKVDHDLHSLEGTLLPGNEPFTIPAACSKMGLPDDTVFLFMGNFISPAYIFPHTVLRVFGEKALVIDRNTDGSVAISLRVLSRDGRVIAKIEKNRFIVNQNNILKMRREDKSSLSVLDEYGRQVLSIRYLSPKAIKLYVELELGYQGTRLAFPGDTRVASLCFDPKASKGADFDIPPPP